MTEYLVQGIVLAKDLSQENISSAHLAHQRFISYSCSDSRSTVGCFELY